MYTRTFRNTFAVDILEYFEIINSESLILEESDKNTDVEANDGNDSSSVNNQASHGEPKNNDEEVAEELESFRCLKERDPYLVDFEGDSDPEHPLNWPAWKRYLVIVEIMILTCVTYMGSSIYTAGQLEIQEEFHVGHVPATLNLSLYVLGYGLGPMILSPLSEFARYGRQHIYIVTLCMFAIFQAGCATVRSFGGLVVIRFITGVLCSPSLATGAATIGDVTDPKLVPVFIGLWAVAGVAAPVLAPLLGATMVVAKNWRWIFWLLMMLSGAILVVLIFFLPETYAPSILYRKAQRLNRINGVEEYYTAQDKEERKLSTKDFAIATLYRPFLLIFHEPIILAFDVYIALCYGTFYIFFEAFPIVFVGIYHFTLIELGLSYMGFLVGSIIAYTVFLVFAAKVIAPKVIGGTLQPESFLLLAMCVSWAFPAALFMFGWTAGVHWILPIVAQLLFVLCFFNFFQASFAFLAMSYPRYMASVFAGNGFCRAVFACSFPLFGQALFNNLGSEKYPVGWGSSLLGFVSIGLAIIPFAIYKYGPYIRSKSSYAG